jgi:hypothetical protein
MGLVLIAQWELVRGNSLVIQSLGGFVSIQCPLSRHLCSVLDLIICFYPGLFNLAFGAINARPLGSRMSLKMILPH